MPTLGRRASLAQALTRLRGQDGLAEVLLVVDAEADLSGAQRMWETAQVPGRLILAEQTGVSAKRNAGWRAARGEVVLFLDDDVLADRDLVAVHAREHDLRPEEDAAVLGSLRWAKGLRVSAFMRWLEEGLQFDFAGLKPGQETGWWHFYTANASVKQALLARVDGFDADAFPFGYEDLDAAKRMAHARGFRLRYVPEAGAEHTHEMALDEWRRRMELVAPAERRFVARHPEVPPYFHDRFARLGGHGPRGRAARIVDVVPQRLPWLGPRVHAAARGYWEHELARAFLGAWEAERATAPST